MQQIKTFITYLLEQIGKVNWFHKIAYMGKRYLEISKLENHKLIKNCINMKVRDSVKKAI